jgi:hypothetical protein
MNGKTACDKPSTPHVEDGCFVFGCSRPHCRHKNRSFEVQQHIVVPYASKRDFVSFSFFMHSAGVQSIMSDDSHKQNGARGFFCQDSRTMAKDVFAF